MMVEVEVRAPRLASEWAIETGACAAWLSDRVRRCNFDTERRSPFTIFLTPPLIFEGESLAGFAALDGDAVGEEGAREEDDILRGGT